MSTPKKRPRGKRLTPVRHVRRAHERDDIADQVLPRGTCITAGTCIPQGFSRYPWELNPLHCNRVGTTKSEALADLAEKSGIPIEEIEVEPPRTFSEDAFEELANELVGRMGMSYAVLTLHRSYKNWVASVHFTSQQPTMATVVSTTGYRKPGTSALQALTEGLKRYKALKKEFGK